MAIGLVIIELYTIHSENVVKIKLFLPVLTFKDECITFNFNLITSVYNKCANANCPLIF